MYKIAYMHACADEGMMGLCKHEYIKSMVNGSKCEDPCDGIQK